MYEFANLGISPQFDVQDPIFITEGIEIEEETDGSTLTVHNLQLEDQVFKMDFYFYGFLVHILFFESMKPHRQGLIQCVAVNHVGKAVASTELCVFCVPRFASKFFFLCFVFCVRCSEICK